MPKIAVSKRGNKTIVPFSVNNKTYRIELFYVNMIAVKLNKDTETFELLEECTQKEILEYIRQLVLNLPVVSTQTIEHRIILHCIQKTLQKPLLALTYDKVK
jgi:hypothetical protein